MIEECGDHLLVNGVRVDIGANHPGDPKVDNRAETEVKKKSGAIRIVRANISDTPITIAEIVKKTSLRSEQVSMSLCNLLKREIVEREKVNRTGTAGRLMVYAYKLKSSPLPDGV